MCKTDEKKVYDIGIIGGGPAGYTAALHAASKGLSVILFEKEELGGVCLNKGCIPTKSILHLSEIYRNLTNSHSYGISAKDIEFDYSKIIENKNTVVSRLKKGLELALKNAKVEVQNSEAEIINSRQIQSNNQIFNCDKIICAVGAEPREIKGLEFDHQFILSSDDVLKFESLPENVLIVGSGAIGIEWARIFNNFGVQTTIIELAQHLLPIADIEVSKRIERIFKSSGIKYYTGVSVSDVSDKTVTLSNGEIVKPDIIFVAVGRVPNKIEKIDGVDYIGDVSGEIQLAHYAVKQAINLVDGIPFRKDLIPSVVYGTPEIAWVGLREQDLSAVEYKKSITLLSALGKAQCDMQTEGFIKILSHDNKIIGAHIMSNEASSILQQVLIAMQNNISVDKLKEVCFPHPTYSEGIFDTLFKI